MAFSSLADELDLELEGGYDDFAGGYDHGLSLADELDGPDDIPLDRDAGLGSLALELDAPAHELDYAAERLPSPPRANGHHHSHSSPRRSPPRALQVSTNGHGRRSPSPLPEQEGRVYLTDFESSLEASEAFVARLRAGREDGLELRLSALVTKLNQAERERDEGLRELGALLREFEAVRGEGLDVDLRLSELAGLAESSRVGWTGEVPDAAIEEEDEDESPPGSPASPLTPLTPATPRPAPRRGRLPRCTAELAAHTLSLGASLGAVLELSSVGLSSIASTSARQLKGAKVALASYRATQDYEDACADAVARFEERIAAGRRRDARAEMDAVLAGFAQTLGRVERDWERTRARAPARAR